MSKVSKMYASDEVFREVADLLYGGGADELVAKYNPEGFDISTGERKKRERRQAQVGLASNIVGLAAGGQAIYDQTKNPIHRTKTGTTLKLKPIQVSRKTKALAAGALGLQALNLGGDVVANRVLARSAKEPKKKREVKKNHEDYGFSTSKGKLTMISAEKGIKAGKQAAPKVQSKLKQVRAKMAQEASIGKAEGFDVTWEGEISKIDTDKRQVFGWASIVEMNGEPVVDLQGDYISIEEIEKSAYEYVVKSRKGGDMHRRDGEVPMHTSDMIESFLVTPEKVEKMGLSEGSLPLGWWVGYQVNDDEVWDLVKSGKRTGFSIHGRGQRSM